MHNLDANKAPGPDGIHPTVLKHCSSEVAPILKVIFVQSLSTGNIPSDWLLANITPVYKKGNKDLPANYRPISLTSVCSKVMEHIIYHSIMNHLDGNNVLSSSQHGFRTGYSCSTQLVSLIEDLNFHMDRNVQVDMILLDFSKAFDTVPHRRLLDKLKFYHIESNIMRWIEQWLTARHQRVLLDGESSDYVPVLSGVPQGTVLGPLMFLIYINDITENISSQLKLFADDCLLYRAIRTEQDALLLQKDLDSLSQWATIWQMRFNPSKCTVMRCTRSQTPFTTNYFLCGSTLSTSHNHQYLGVTLDDQLSWSAHIINVANKATRMLNFIKRHLSKCSQDTKTTAYLLLVRPVMEYASVAWDPHYQTQISLLEKVQRRAARWVLSDYSYHSSVTNMLNKLKWLPLSKRRKQQRLNLYYPILSNNV